MNPTRSVNSTETSRRSDGADVSTATGAAGATARPGATTSAASGAPQSPQNRSSGSFAAPHAGHVTASAAPQFAQNLRPGRFSAPQEEQVMVPERTPRSHASRVRGMKG